MKKMLALMTAGMLTASACGSNVICCGKTALEAFADDDYTSGTQYSEDNDSVYLLSTTKTTAGITAPPMLPADTVDKDFIVTPKDVSVMAGESAEIEIMIDNKSNRKVGQFIVRVDNANLPIKGATATMTDTFCYAVNGNKEYELLNDTWYCDTLASGEPQAIDTAQAVCQFQIKIPADTKPGEYEWKIDRFHVVENGYDGVEFDANIQPGKIIVEGRNDSPSVTTTTAKTNDNVKADVDEGFIVKPEDVEAEPGQSVDIDIKLENKSNRKAGQLIVRVDNANLPIKGATATMTDTFCYAVDGNKEYELLNDTWYCDTLASGEPQAIDTTQAVCQFQIKIPADTKPGEYEWKIDRFHVVENGYDGVEFDANIQPGKIIVKGEGAVVTNATTKTTSATTTKATTNPVTPSGSVDEGFIVTPADIKAKAGETVDVDIMLNNKSGRKVGQFIVRVDNANLPIKGATATMADTFCYAVDGNKEYELINDTWYCDTLASGEPQAIDTTQAVCQFQIKIPSDAKAGEYEWKIDRFHVVENGYDGVEFDANIQPGKIVVEGGDAVVTTTTEPAKTTAAITTTTAKTPQNSDLNVDEGFIITPVVANVKPGEPAEIEIRLENKSNRKVGQFVVRVDNANLPIKGATVTMEDTFCYAVDGNKEYELINDTWYCDTLASGEPQAIDTTQAVCQLVINIPADAQPGEYEWKIDRFHVVENGYDGVEFDANIQPGKIVVGGSSELKYKLGDVNMDGKVNAVDASETLREYASRSTSGEPYLTEIQRLAADVDRNGKVDAIDASYILMYYSYLSTGGTDDIEVYLKDKFGK